MKTDQEALEAAARAAGLRPFQAWGKSFVMGDGSPAKAEWNPLIDDGDALRLAVRLGISVKHYQRKGYVIAAGGVGVGYKGDPCAATRRAIVLAAARAQSTPQPPAPPADHP